LIAIQINTPNTTKGKMYEKKTISASGKKSIGTFVNGNNIIDKITTKKESKGKTSSE